MDYNTKNHRWNKTKLMTNMNKQEILIKIISMAGKNKRRWDGQTIAR